MTSDPQPLAIDTERFRTPHVLTPPERPRLDWFPPTAHPAKHVDVALAATDATSAATMKAAG